MIEDLIDLLVGNLGITFENLVLVITILGSLLFFAKDFRIGIIILFLFFAGEFMIFSLLEMETFAALMGVLVSLVVLTLSLWVSHSKAGAIV